MSLVGHIIEFFVNIRYVVLKFDSVFFFFNSVVNLVIIVWCGLRRSFVL